MEQKETKKILVLSASARKGGNTDLLCDEFIKGANDAGHSVEKLYIGSMRIKGCVGCGACRRNGGQCAQRDDMADIYEKLLAADVIAFASPVYFYSFNAQMKAVMDRTFAIEQILTDKTAYLLTTGAAPREEYMSVMVEQFKKYLSCFNRFTVGGIIIGCGTTDKGSIKDTPAMNEAYAAGQNIP